VPRLGEILADMQVCSEAQIRQGLENQVIFGGRLGTNLLELGSLAEEQLAHGLERRHGRPCLHGNLHVDPAALPLLKPELVDRLEVVPYIAQDRKLAVLVRDPDDLSVLDEVAFATGKRIHPIVAPEARIWALMRRHYRIDRNLRGIFLEGVGARRPRPTPKVAAQRKPAAPDLMDQAEFEALYVSRGEQQAAAPPDEILEAVEEIPPAADQAARAEVLSAMSQEAAGHAPRPTFTPTPSSLPATAAPEPEPSPLSFDEALHVLEGVADRNAIAHAVLRYARSRFKRAVLLTIHGGAAGGWDGLGEGIDRAAVRRLRVPLGTPGVLDTVVGSCAHFLGPLQQTDANFRLLAPLGGASPRSAFVIPILALGRVVNALYADNGRDGTVDAANMGELLILAARIARSYDALVRRTLKPADRPDTGAR
jgi:hypothetical protein